MVFQRIECADAACDKAKAGLSVGFVVRKEESYLRVVPYAIELSDAAAGHRGESYSVATQLALQAPVVDKDAGGAIWVSPPVPLAELKCKTERGAKPACFKAFVVDDKTWENSRILPLPPKTVQAFVVSVAEVGEPPRGLKEFSEFLESSQGDISAVLSDALKQQLGLDQKKE